MKPEPPKAEGVETQKVLETIQRQLRCAYDLTAGTLPSVANIISEQREAIDDLFGARVESRPRVEQCVSCNGWVSEWVDTEESKGRICLPCEWNKSLLARAEEAEAKLAVYENRKPGVPSPEDLTS